jgi:hypothetical protein
MTWTRDRSKQVAAVDAFAFPSGLRQRLALRHEELSSAGIDQVEAATRQWFRLAARTPKAKVSLPSATVDTFWQELALHTHDYAAFCDAAFGRLLPYAAMPAVGAASHLQATLRLAQEDESCASDRLPLLFRVDVSSGLHGARHYLADCGGRGFCYEQTSTICVQHLAGPGRTIRGDWKSPFRTDPGMAPADRSGDLGGMDFGGGGDS